MKQKSNTLLNDKYSLFGYYEAVIFGLLLFNFLLIVDKRFDSFTTTQYLLNYKFGFASRFLIGSIYSLFTDNITNNLIYITVIIFLIFLIFFIALLLGAVIRRSKLDERQAVMTFVVLFISSPLSVSYLFGGYFAKFDMYWVIITLVSVVCLRKSAWRWLVPLLCAAAIMVHQGFMVTYMPAIIIPLLYEVYRSNFAKKEIAILGLSCLAMIGLFIVVQLAPKNIAFDNAVSFSEYLSNNSGINASAPMLWLEYYAKFPDYWLDFHIPLIKTIAIPVGCTMLVFSSSLIVIFGSIWKFSFKHAEKNSLRIIFVLCSLAPMTFAAAALFGTDWDRWWAAVINNQFILLFYFIFARETVVIDAVKKVGVYFEKNFLLFLLIIVFTNSLVFSRAATLLETLLLSDNNKSFRFMWDYFNKNVYSVVTGS